MATQLLVLESHRYHCLVIVVGLFVHDAAFSVSVWPCSGVPVMKGDPLSAGGDGRADPAELMDAEPPAFVAVTCTSVVNPASAEASVYVEAVAPEIALHASGEPEQRCHW